MLRFVVRLTALLLGLGSVLVIVGIFDAFLGWDIFSPQLEAVLQGVFFSCLALAVAGIALSFVLGVQEITDLLRASQGEQVIPATRRYVGAALGGLALLLAVVAALDAADRRVQGQRNLVFQRLAAERIEPLMAKLVVALPAGAERPKPSAEVDELITSINDHAWVEQATMFLPDAVDPERMWEYDEFWDGTTSRSRFDRIYPSNDHERAVLQAFAGKPEALTDFNQSSRFAFLHPLHSERALIAVVWIKANRKESLRD